jgi:hypothetical protein
MSTLIKKKMVFLPLALLFVSLFSIADGQIAPFRPPLTEQESALRDKTLTFLADVFELDLSEYNTIQVTADYQAPFPNSVFVNFKFESSKGKLDVTSLFSNDELLWCKLYPIKVAPMYTTSSSSNIINSAKNTIDKVNAFSPKEYLPTMRNMLNAVSKLESSKVTIGNFTQEIEVRENTVEMIWEPFANGLSHPQYKLYFEFKDGHLVQYCNYLDIYKIGSSEVNISENQAIKIATNYAQIFSYDQYGETVSNFTVLENIAHAKISLDNRGDYTLYPFWSIKLPLDRMYLGGVTSFSVGIWADTGEIEYFTPMGSYGSDPSIASSEPGQTPSPTIQATSENNQAAVPDSLIIVGSTVLVAATVAITAYLLCRRKK